MTSIYGNINDLYLFCSVVTEGSLLKASKVLDLPVSTMSRRLSSLEARLNIRLLQKEGRELVPTDAGQHAYDSLISGIEQLESSYSEILHQQSEVSGRIKVSLPHNFYQGFAGEVIEKFLKTYPKVSFELALSHHQAIPNTDREIVLTFDTSNLQGMIARPIFKARHGFFVSQAFLRENPLPTEIKSLENWRWINVFYEEELPVYRNEKLCHVLKVKPSLVVNDMVSTVDAVEKGLGIASLPITHVKNRPNLVQVFPDYHRSDRQAYIVYKERKYQPKVLTLLVNALIEAAKSMQKSN